MVAVSQQPRIIAGRMYVIRKYGRRFLEPLSREMALSLKSARECDFSGLAEHAGNAFHLLHSLKARLVADVSGRAIDPALYRGAVIWLDNRYLAELRETMTRAGSELVRRCGCPPPY